MTIEEAINGYTNGKLVLDKLVCQFVRDGASRVIYKFVIYSDNLYLRKEEIAGFNEFIREDLILTDSDVDPQFPQYISDFLSSDSLKIYDIYKRDIPIPAEIVLSQDFLVGHELEGRHFLSY